MGAGDVAGHLVKVPVVTISQGVVHFEVIVLAKAHRGAHDVEDWNVFCIGAAGGVDGG